MGQLASDIGRWVRSHSKHTAVGFPLLTQLVCLMDTRGFLEQVRHVECRADDLCYWLTCADPYNVVPTFLLLLRAAFPPLFPCVTSCCVSRVLAARVQSCARHCSQCQTDESKGGLLDSLAKLLKDRGTRGLALECHVNLVRSYLLR